MALVNRSKFATFVFLICTMVATFGSGAELVIKKVVANIDENCSKNGEMCFVEKDTHCCEGLLCLAPAIWPPVPGICAGPTPQMKLLTKQPQCRKKGQRCYPKFKAICCEGLLCEGPFVFGPGTCVEP